MFANLVEMEVMILLNLSSVAQPYHPLHISSSAATQIRHRISVLEALNTYGGNSQSRVRTKAGLNWNQSVSVIEELEEAGLIKRIQLRGDREWLSISKQGKHALELWYSFIHALCGEAY